MVDRKKTERITPFKVLDISEGNNVFFFKFPNHSSIEGYGIEITSGMCAYADACDENKFVIQTGHCTSQCILLFEMQ